MVKFTYAGSLYQKDGWEPNVDFDDFFKDLKHASVKSKDAAPVFSPAHFANGKRRKRDIVAISGLVYDFDHEGVTFEDVVRTLEKNNIKAAVYTTFSHMKNGTEKFRVIIPFDREWVNPEEKLYQKVHAYIAQALGFKGYDVTSNQIGRVYFVPSYAEGTDPSVHKYTFVDGKSLKIEALKKEASKINIPATHNVSPKSTEDAVSIDEEYADKDPYFVLKDGKAISFRRLWLDYADVNLADIVAKKIPEIIIKERAAGGYHIICPFAHEHTVDRGENETGTFVDNPREDTPFATVCCLHEHCAHRTTVDFVYAWIISGKLSLEDITGGKTALESRVKELPFDTEDMAIIPKEKTAVELAQEKAKKLVDEKEDIPFDAQLFSAKILTDNKLAKKLYFAANVSSVINILEEHGIDVNDAVVLYMAVAFSSTEYSEIKKHYPDVHADILRFRHAIRDIDEYVQELLARYSYKPEVWDEIVHVSELYGLPKIDVVAVFRKIRIMNFLNEGFEFSSPYEKEACLHALLELDTNVRKILKSLVTKTVTPGDIYVHLDDIPNTVVPKTYHTVETLKEVIGRLYISRGDNKPIHIVDYWASLPNLYPTVREIICDPAPVEDDNNNTVLNTYAPEKNIPSIPVEDAEIEKELEIIKEVLANGDEDAWRYILTWVAHTHQFPHIKIPNAIFFEGVHGAGKSVCIDALFCKPHGVFATTIYDKEHLIGKFNAVLAGKKMVFFDEVSEVLNFRDDGILKYLITGPTIRIEPKGVDARIIPSRHQFVMASNLDNVIVLDRNDRRVSYFKTSSKYYKAVDMWDKLIDRFESQDFIGKLKYYLENLDPMKKWGIDWQWIIRPYENEERKRRTNAPQNTVDKSVEHLYLAQKPRMFAFEMYWDNSTLREYIALRIRKEGNVDFDSLPVEICNAAMDTIFETKGNFSFDIMLNNNNSPWADKNRILVKDIAAPAFDYNVFMPPEILVAYYYGQKTIDIRTFALEIDSFGGNKIKFSSAIKAYTKMNVEGGGASQFLMETIKTGIVTGVDCGGMGDIQKQCLPPANDVLKNMLKLHILNEKTLPSWAPANLTYDKTQEEKNIDAEIVIERKDN